MITGANAWIKPLKFAISLPLYSFTLTWLLTYSQGRRRLVQSIASVTGIVAIIETVLITLQVIRGTTSHFNVSTAFDAAVFSTIGIAITLVALMNLLTVILLSVQRLGNPVFTTALRFGVLISFVGMLVAYLMTAGPTPTQLAALEAGGDVTLIGAHSVGVEEWSPRACPLWAGAPLAVICGCRTLSACMGLRCCRCWGCSSPAVVPLFAQGQRTGFIWALGLGYVRWLILLTWQALRAVDCDDGPRKLVWPISY